MSQGFESTACSDCSFPPNHSATKLGSKDQRIERFSVKCRDCGDSWEENYIKEVKD